MEYLAIAFVILCPFYGWIGGNMAAKRNTKGLKTLLVIYFWPIYLIIDFKNIFKTQIEMKY